jgi:hypothetical protein
MREFTACVQTKSGTQTVTVKEWTAAGATEKLLKMGYISVIWVL